MVDSGFQDGMIAHCCARHQSFHGNQIVVNWLAVLVLVLKSDKRGIMCGISV